MLRLLVPQPAAGVAADGERHPGDPLDSHRRVGAVADRRGVGRGSLGAAQGHAVRPVLHGCRAGRGVAAGLLHRADRAGAVQLQVADLPERAVRELHDQPAGMGTEPDIALDRPGVSVRRPLCQADPGGHAGDDERGLHTHRPGERPARTQGDRQARPARRADPDRDHLRHGPRAAARRRHHHRGDLLDARSRPVHGRGRPEPGPARDPRGHDAGRLLHRAGQPGGGHPLRLCRPEGEVLMPTETLLEVEDLKIQFQTQDGLVKSVDGVSFSLERGRTLGIVGESGSGKSVTSLGIMGLHHGSNARISGHIRLDGEDLVAAAPGRVRELRGSKMAMIFQDPLSSLHPYYKIGNQIIEAYRVHHPEATKQQARHRAIDMLERVGIPEPSARVDDYPHQFSGGMRQRVMIAMALCNDPELLIADEPTTALDVTVQAQILDLIHDLQSEFGSAVIMITHDLGVVAELSDDILVMYAGRVAEYGSAADIFASPGHPYTWGLLASMPRMDRERLTRLVPIPGTPPSLIKVPSGCPFHPRCRYGHLNGGRSETEVPELRATENTGHLVACHLTAAERTRQWALLSAGKVPDDVKEPVQQGGVEA